ncbi:MAG: alpha/beta hydrolase [Chloroflexi bacterium]|nr:alpha/beta hydrolase [Chloroflexota bacterium]
MSSLLEVKTWGGGSSNYVALHGWGGSHDTFAPIVPMIPDSAQVEAPDLPGYGKSAHPENWKTEEVAEMVADSVNLEEPVTIIGNCTGGVIGAELAKLAPTRVKRLVMIDPFAYVPWYFSIFLKGTFGKMAYMTTFASPIGRFFTNQALRSKRTGDSDLTASFDRVDHEAVHSFLRMMYEHEGPERYADLDVPVDLIVGEKTFSAVRKSSLILKETLPNVRIRTLPGAGHLPIEEQTEAVAKVIFGNE